MIKLLLSWILVGNSLSAAVVVQWEKDIKSAIAKSNKEHKPLMVVVTKYGCKWCDVLKKNTLENSNVVKVLNRDFVSYEGIVDEGTVPPSLMTPGTPGTWFLKGNQPMFAPVMGAVKAEDFMDALETVKKEYAK